MPSLGIKKHLPLICEDSVLSTSTAYSLLVGCVGDSDDDADGGRMSLVNATPQLYDR